MLLLSSLPSLPSIPVAHLQPPPTIAATGVVSTRRTLLLPLLPPLHPLSVAHSSSHHPPWRPLALCQPVVHCCYRCCLRCTDLRSVVHLQPPTTVAGATAGSMGATAGATAGATYIALQSFRQGFAGTAMVKVFSQHVFFFWLVFVHKRTVNCWSDETSLGKSSINYCAESDNCFQYTPLNSKNNISST